MAASPCFMLLLYFCFVTCITVLHHLGLSTFAAFCPVKKTSGCICCHSPPVSIQCKLPIAAGKIPHSPSPHKQHLPGTSSFVCIVGLETGSSQEWVVSLVTITTSTTVITQLYLVQWMRWLAFMSKNNQPRERTNTLFVYNDRNISFN